MVSFTAYCLLFTYCTFFRLRNWGTLAVAQSEPPLICHWLWPLYSLENALFACKDSSDTFRFFNLWFVKRFRYRENRINLFCRKQGCHNGSYCTQGRKQEGAKARLLPWNLRLQFLNCLTKIVMNVWSQLLYSSRQFLPSFFVRLRLAVRITTLRLKHTTFTRCDFYVKANAQLTVFTL